MTAPSVCHLVISLAYGGLERLVVDWTNARNRRFPGSTAVCCLDEGGDLAPELEGDVLKVLAADRTRFPWDTTAAGALRQMLKGSSAEGIHIVHSHNITAQQYAVIASRRTPVQHLHTEHGSNAFTEGWLNRARLRRLAKASGALVCVSNDTATRIAPYWACGFDRIRVIPNGVLPHPDFGSENDVATRRECKIEDNITVIGSVGRLSREKGYDRLIPVVAELVRRERRVVLLIVGDGPERYRLEQDVREAGIADAVVFTGYQENGRRFYDAMDLFVLPSRSEGLSIALLEAMAGGCPLAVTDVGENRVVLDGGRAGRLLSDDERDWADMIDDILWGEGQATTPGLVRFARQRVSDQYSFEQTAEAYENAYRSLMASALCES